MAATHRCRRVCQQKTRQAETAGRLSSVSEEVNVRPSDVRASSESGLADELGGRPAAVGLSLNVFFRG